MILVDFENFAIYFNDLLVFRKQIYSISWDKDDNDDYRTVILYEDETTEELYLNEDSHSRFLKLAEEYQQKWKENSPLFNESRPLSQSKVLTEL